MFKQVSWQNQNNYIKLYDTMTASAVVRGPVSLCIWIVVCFWSSQTSYSGRLCKRDRFDSAIVVCELTGEDPYNVSYLHNISSLTYLVRDLFFPGVLQLGHHCELKELSFHRHPLYATFHWPLFDFMIYSNSTKSPHPLAFLERLEIEIPLYMIDAALFKHLGRLRYFDLSRTFGLKASYISQILQALSYAGAPLEHLDLSSSRCLPQLPLDTLNIREDIVKNLGTFPLKYFDIRAVDAVQFGVGFAEFTPGLENLYLGGYQLPVGNRDIEYCLWMDISILPNITNIVFDLGPWNRNPDDVPCPGAWAQMNISNSRGVSNCSARYEGNSCQLSRCECYKKINNYPFLHEYTQSLVYTKISTGRFEPIDTAAFPPFPVPPKLRYLSISPRQMQFREGNLIVSQHNIGLTHLQYHRHARTIDPFSRFGLKVLVSELKDIIYLDMQIGEIYDTAAIWYDMPNLEALHLGQNELHIIRRNPFSGSPNLRLLNLTGCDISLLPGLANLTNLNHLDVSHNRLKDMPSNVTASLDSLATQAGLYLDLSKNPLNCDCHNQEFFRWLRNSNVNFTNKNGITCQHPLHGTVNPWDVDPVELSRYCSHFQLILTTTVSSILSVSLVLIILLIVRKRWTIKYWLHAARTSWNQKQFSCARSRHNYRYDAFVAYCSQDEEERKWVHLTLTTVLEREYGFKLCIIEISHLAMILQTILCTL